MMEAQMMRNDSEEHVLARANYYKGLVTKTTDPVYWPEEKLRQAIVILLVAAKLEPQNYESALFAAQVACHKVAS
ncbi:hypothetical protein HYT04_02955 [Candidatus Kaiserbacteria bacterium]|nr:hypothetical protein [Candidatus Kaiserbacteria bacterium]